jgi:hypothetical protein
VRAGSRDSTLPPHATIVPELPSALGFQTLDTTGVYVIVIGIVAIWFALDRLELALVKPK